jgi:hypothetical protein
MWQLLIIVIILILIGPQLLKWVGSKSEPVVGLTPLTSTDPTNMLPGTYWDGEFVHPCSECTDRNKCPGCPQFALYTRPQQSIEAFEVPTLRVKYPSPQDMASEILNSTPLDMGYSMEESEMVSQQTHGYDPSEGAAMRHDLDPDFIRSRSCVSQSSCNRTTGASRTLDVALLGTRNDDIFDGERAAAHGCPGRYSVNKLLYKDFMGLSGGRPSIDCEYLNANGYSYKQRCDYGW